VILVTGVLLSACLAGGELPGSALFSPGHASKGREQKKSIGKD